MSNFGSKIRIYNIRVYNSSRHLADRKRNYTFRMTKNELIDPKDSENIICTVMKLGEISRMTTRHSLTPVAVTINKL